MVVQLHKDEQTPAFDVLVGKDTFIDKTLMIKKILSGPRLLHITAPPGFGKTTNLDMIRKFFEVIFHSGHRVHMESTNNYSLFSSNKLAITDEGELMNHLGTSFVIYLDCKCNRILRNLEEMKHFCLEIIHSAYKQHEYLKYSNINFHKEKVENWCDNHLWNFHTVSDVQTGLHLLMRTLTYYCNRIDIIVLVDNLDSPLMALIRDQYRSQPSSTRDYYTCRNLYFGMLAQVIKYNGVKKVILSGTFHTQSVFIFEELHHYDFLSDETYTPFYGATDTEVNKLLKKFGVPLATTSDVKHHFGRYMSKHGNWEMYHLQNVLLFLKQYRRTRVVYFDVSTLNFDVILQHALSHSQVQCTSWQLIRKSDVPCESHIPSLTVEEFLKSDFPDRSHVIQSTDWFSLYLLQLGYVSYAKPEVPLLREDKCCAFCQLRCWNEETINIYRLLGRCLVKIPNEAAFAQMEKFLFDYYERHFSLSKSNILQCGILLDVLGPYSHVQKFKDFSKALCDLFHVNYFRQKHASVYLAFFPVVLAARSYQEVYREQNVNSEVILLSREDFVLSIYVTTGYKTPEEAFRDAEKEAMATIRRAEIRKEILCLGINVTVIKSAIPRVKVDIMSEMLSYEGPPLRYKRFARCYY